jgi:hypothetical protein
MIPMGQWLATLPRQAEVPEDGMAMTDFAVPPEASASAAEQEAAVQAAYERGRSESDAANQQMMQAHLERQRAAQAEELAAARAEWCVAQAGVLADRFAGALAALEDRLSQQVVAVLAPFLEDRARQQAVTQFRAALHSLAGNGGGLVRLEAPADLMAALRAQPGGLPDGIDGAVADHADILAAGDATVIETTLSSWLGAIGEARS